MTLAELLAEAFDAVDLFAGPGGWSEGCRRLGLRDLGVEHGAPECATRYAAGHASWQQDVAAVPSATIRLLFADVRGLIGSPPCPQFSSAGSGNGRRILDELRVAIREAFAGEADFTAHIEAMAEVIYDQTTLGARLADAFDLADRAVQSAREAALTIEPARWFAAMRPEWVALEQVPEALPLWAAYAEHLRAAGYSVWCGILCAADFGVPQTRRRAILMASRVRPATPPTPTHAADPTPTLFGELAPWVSMAEALGWGFEEPARTVCGARGLRWAYEDRDGSRGRVLTRGPDARPAPTVLGSWDNGDTVWLDRRQQKDGKPVAMVSSDRPAPTVTVVGGADGQWVWRRPATTIMGDSRVWPPGHKVNSDDRRRLGAAEAAERYGDRAGTAAGKVTLDEASALQDFPPGYPWQGNRTETWTQVGNAVPPGLAASIVERLAS